MWPSIPEGAPSTGYRDPTALFAESDTASTTTTTCSVASNVDCRTLQDLMEAGSRTPAASMHARATRGPRGADARAQEEWARRQRERQERRFFRKRGALDYQRSVVFSRAAREPSTRVENATYAHPQQRQRGFAFQSTIDDEPAGDCVPKELQPWYVASNSAVRRAPASAAAKPWKSRHSSAHAASVGSEDIRPGAEGFASAGTLTGPFTAADVADGLGIGCESGKVDAFGSVVVRSSIRSAGAGTTSVNVLQSRPASRSGYVAQLPETGRVRAAAGSRRGRTPTSAGAAQPAALLSSGFIREGSASDQAAGGKPVVSGDACDDVAPGAGGEGTAKVSATAAAVTDSDSVEWHAWGGRPPLRAHCYVEQPNGIFLDHARHAELLAEYAVEAEMRHARENDDACRARRWTRHLYGRSGEEARRGGGLRQDGTMPATASANASATAMARGRYHWLYDAATYRQRFVSTLRYLQRVHVFLVAFAAGVSLLMLLAITVPFPGPSVSGAGDGGGASAVLLLALFADASATPTGASAAAHVLPVMEQGDPALALVLALFQVYHTSLLLCLCLLLVITGCAPVPWSVAEWYWMAQRRRWLQEEHEGAERAIDLGSEAGTREERGGRGGGRSTSAASSNDIAFASGSSAAGLRGLRGTSCTARRGATSSSNALGDDTGKHGGGSRSALFATMCSHHSPDDRLSLSMGGDGGWVKREAHISDELNCGATYAYQHYRKDSYPHTDSGLATTGGWGMWVAAQQTPPSAATMVSPRGHKGVSAFYNPLHHNSASGSPIGSATTDTLWRHQQHKLQGAFTLRRTHSAAALSAAPFLAPATAAAQWGGGASVNRALRPQPSLMLSPVSALEGGLSADNVFTRTFDHIERCAMQRVCDALHKLAHAFCVPCARRGDGTITSSGAGGAQGGKTREAAVSPHSLEGGASVAGRGRGFSPSSAEIHHTNSRAYAPFYVHFMFQPRLWCVVVALVLTIVEIAFVDERSVELLWLAQPPSWWLASATPPQRTVTTGDVFLPHVWTVVNFTPMPARTSGGGVPLAATASDAPVLPDDAECTSGHVWRVLMAVYATRMAVLWVSLMLNLFF
ncbi:hypothetical protein LSCM4_08280 [Leishmania orientalis]|uniref:Uncharacterized protein n=1 Tax=Leishmania orientalis TaxID=2249476 RepID=A0A836HPN2_9TRYP|nr:hypothetical protein LSCM4_08280 [Leishmania orientalis]